MNTFTVVCRAKPLVQSRAAGLFPTFSNNLEIALTGTHDFISELFLAVVYQFSYALPTYQPTYPPKAKSNLNSSALTRLTHMLIVFVSPLSIAYV